MNHSTPIHLKTTARVVTGLIFALLALGGGVLHGQYPRTIGKLVGQWPDLPSDLQAIEIEGNYAYVAMGEEGMGVLDLTVPTAPSLIGTLEEIDIRGLAVDGNRVCAIGGYGKDFGDWHSTTDLSIINVSDPSVPKLLGRVEGCSEDLCTTPGFAIDLVGDFAYLALGRNGLQIIDVSDASQPAGVARLTTVVTDVEVRNGLAYVVCPFWDTGDETGRLYVVDVADPTQPRTIGELSVGQGLGSVALTGDYAYLGNTFGSDLEGGAYVVDVSDPTAPSVIGGFDGPHPSLWAPHARLHIANDVVFMSAYMMYGGGVFVLDDRSPTALSVLGGLPGGLPSPNLGRGATDVAFFGGYGYVALGERGLWTYDLRGLFFTNLRLTSEEAKPTATWDLGTLQFSPTVNGPWTDLPAASPMPVSLMGEKGFFRVKVE